MNIEQAAYAHMRTHAALTALVGDRISPLVVPQGAALPAISYLRVSGTKQRMLTGSGPRRVRLQLSCWGATYAAAKAVAAQVEVAFQDYQGLMGGPEGLQVLDCDVLDNPDLYDDTGKTYHVPLDVMILYRGGA